MRTFKALFGEITSFENLYEAASRARKGKRLRPDVAQFHNRLEHNLFQLQVELLTRSYVPQAYTTFYVYDPKKRMISASTYRDRVVHHALCQVIGPLFERSFIHDSYANQKGKGTHKALIRYQQFAQKYAYVLKCDIRKFFPSIDHVILKKTLHRKVTCEGTLWLIDLIIDHSNPQEAVDDYFWGDDPFTPHIRRKGLPIGNLTSQFWGNVYLDAFDHFLKDQLGYKGYIRYVDDFVIFSNDKPELHRLKQKIGKYLEAYRLKIHPDKTQVFAVASGVPFLGFRVFPTYRYVLKPKVKRYKRHIRKAVKELKVRAISPQEMENKLNAWLGHIRFGKNYYTEQQVFFYIRDQGVNLVKHPGGSWRVLEQQ